MYKLYAIRETAFGSKKLLSEYKELDKARERAENELEKDPEFKYTIEETTGHVDSYGELLSTIIDEN